MRLNLGPRSHAVQSQVQEIRRPGGSDKAINQSGHVLEHLRLGLWLWFPLGVAARVNNAVAVEIQVGYWQARCNPTLVKHPC